MVGQAATLLQQKWLLIIALLSPSTESTLSVAEVCRREPHPTILSRL